MPNPARSISVAVRFTLLPGSFKAGEWEIEFQTLGGLQSTLKTPYIDELASVLPAILWLEPPDLQAFLDQWIKDPNTIRKAWHQAHLKEYERQHKPNDQITVDDLMSEL